jgi:calcineurin-like phosphoesterase family protein
MMLRMRTLLAGGVFLAGLLLISFSAQGGGPPASPAVEQTAVLVGAGDIADCRDLSGAEATAKLLEKIPGTVMAVGDLAYPDGTKENFECYDRTWGRVKSRTRPAAGNHEFHSAGATYYFSYFGEAAGDPKTGYYSYELGAWHIIVLNSECKEVGGCNAGSRQEKWLRADLAAHPVACTLAYFHKPRFSSGNAHGDDPELGPFWDALYEANADVVVNGHDHDYERFAPQTPNASPDPKRGIREFVVGTGGKNQRTFVAPHANSEVRNADGFGVLKLTLRPSGYDWQFIPEAGKSFTDSGSGNCH